MDPSYHQQLEVQINQLNAFVEYLNIRLAQERLELAILMKQIAEFEDLLKSNPPR